MFKLMNEDMWAGHGTLWMMSMVHHRILNYNGNTVT